MPRSRFTADAQVGGLTRGLMRPVRAATLAIQARERAAATLVPPGFRLTSLLPLLLHSCKSLLIDFLLDPSSVHSFSRVSYAASSIRFTISLYYRFFSLHLFGTRKFLLFFLYIFVTLHVPFHYLIGAFQ